MSPVHTRLNTVSTSSGQTLGRFVKHSRTSLASKSVSSTRSGCLIRGNKSNKDDTFNRKRGSMKKDCVSSKKVNMAKKCSSLDSKPQLSPEINNENLNLSLPDSSTEDDTSDVDISESVTIRRRDLNMSRRLQHSLKCRCIPKSRLQYTLKDNFRESIGHPLFGVDFYPFVSSTGKYLIAMCGGNTVNVYETSFNERMTLKASFRDSDNGGFYCVKWARNSNDFSPMLVAGDQNGIVRIIDVTRRRVTKSLQCACAAINEMCFHPQDSNLLLVASKDISVRLWNISTSKLVAVMSGRGMGGHLDEILTVDWSKDGNQIVAAGMDHFIVVWDISKVHKHIHNSYDNSCTNGLYAHIDVPYFSTHDVHSNYIDCVRFHGGYIISKSCDQRLVCFVPKPEKKSSLEIAFEFDIPQCKLWFIKFAISPCGQFLACGNQVGRVLVWDLHAESPKTIHFTHFGHPSCQTAIRQIAFSPDSKILIAVCDDCTTWKWDLIVH